MADRPSMLSNSSAPRMKMDLVDKNIESFAADSLWEKSYLCPCRLRETRQPDQTCKLCRGRGIAYLPPKPINIIVQSQEKGVFNGDIGLLDTGTAIGTPERGVQVAFRDRITLPMIKVSQSFIFDVTKGRVENGFCMIYDVHSIDLITTMKGELEEGEDYTLDLKNNLLYPKEHLIGQNVSINIQTTLRYMVADLLKEHRYAKNNQGGYDNVSQKLLLKREDIFIDKEAFSTGVDNDKVSEMIDTKRPPAPDGMNGFFRSRGI